MPAKIGCYRYYPPKFGNIKNPVGQTDEYRIGFGFWHIIVPNFICLQEIGV